MVYRSKARKSQQPIEVFPIEPNRVSCSVGTAR